MEGKAAIRLLCYYYNLFTVKWKMTQGNKCAMQVWVRMV